MSQDNIMGYTWDEIQAMQRREYIRPIAKPQPIQWDESDDALLNQYGSIDALSLAGYHGTADRARRLGKV